MHDDEATEPFATEPTRSYDTEAAADGATGGEPTRPLGEAGDGPADGGTGGGAASRVRRFAPYLVGAAIALGVGIALLLDALDDDPVTTGASPGGVATVPTSVRATAPPASRTAPPPSTTAPSAVPLGEERAERTTLAALLARLRADPDAFGERGDDLLAWLERLADDGGLHPSERAALLADLREWVRDGELDPRLAAEVSEVVLAAPTDPDLGVPGGRGRGDGSGAPGRGDDGDDD